MNPFVIVEPAPEPQLRRVVRDVRVCLPFGVGVSVAPDDVHLEVTMYVHDRDHHLRGTGAWFPRQPDPGRPESWGAPFLRQVFSFDMSDEVLAHLERRAIDLREKNPAATDAEVEAVGAGDGRRGRGGGRR